MGSKNGMGPDQVRRMLERYRITSGIGFDLDSFSSDDLPDNMPDKTDAKALLGHGIARVAVLQEQLYANATWSLLVIIQAMDAGGKDSMIKHVMSGLNPQGVSVTSFKAPGPSELAHGFLWRVGHALPARGMIGIFNRSHYEDVLVSRVHPKLLSAAKLPAMLAGGDRFWADRIADIAAFEAYLGRQGTKIVKIFLNLGHDEQKKRLLARLNERDKAWKFDPADLRDRALWPEYRHAYQAAIAGTATEAAPWYIVPADRKWYARLVVAEAIITALDSLQLTSPPLTVEQRDQLAVAREALEAD